MAEIHDYANDDFDVKGTAEMATGDTIREGDRVTFHSLEGLSIGTVFRVWGNGRSRYVSVHRIDDGATFVRLISELVL